MGPGNRKYCEEHSPIHQIQRQGLIEVAGYSQRPKSEFVFRDAIEGKEDWSDPVGKSGTAGSFRTVSKGTKKIQDVLLFSRAESPEAVDHAIRL
jgi:hypothetical protein